VVIRNLRLSWIFGILFGLTFAFLLTLRLGILKTGETDYQENHVLNSQGRWDREFWMNIFQKGEKIGYVHRQFSKTREGYRVLESVFMQINTMGMVQEIRFKTDANLHPELTLASFDFELQSSLFQFKAKGILKNKILSIIAGTPGSEQKVDLPFKKDIYISIGMLETLLSEGLEAGKTKTFDVFDPILMAERPVKISILSQEVIPVMGRQEKARKVSIDFMGASQSAWIGKDGEVLREEGLFGIRLERATREEALQKIALLPNMDFVEIASIPANVTIDNIDRLKELKIRLEGEDESVLFIDGGRQSFQEKVLTIRKESSPNLLPRKSNEEFIKREKRHLESTPFIQSDHPEIQAKVREIVSPDDPSVVKARKLLTWVHKNIQKRPVLSVPNALETLRNRVGDCNEHAVLFTALARAAGIPTEVEVGLVYQKDRFYYHAWNVLYLGSWMTADSVMEQLPADVTHIRFMRGMEGQVDLIGIIGKIRLEILSAS
jgi:hypothetical protein